MPCNENHFIPILDELRQREEEAEARARRRKQKRGSEPPKGTWGGRRPGAGAPGGNLNALKHGRYSRYQQAFIEALMQVPEARDIMIAISKRQRAQTRRAEQGGAALMSELLRRTGEAVLSGGNGHLEDIQDFLVSIRMAEAQLQNILEKQSRPQAKKRTSIKPTRTPPLPPSGEGAGG